MGKFSHWTAAFLAAVSYFFIRAEESYADSRADALQVVANYNHEHHDEWGRILFYHPSLLGGESSLIDAPNFFLSTEGRIDPKMELLEFTRQVFSDQPEEKKVQCRFPRRTKFLKKLLGDQLPLPQITCPDWQKLNATGIYVVFSSYFLESPASYFGHIFLRVEKEGKNGQNNPLLDPMVSFGARPGEVNGFTYLAGGLLGWFPGVFEVAPMYSKIQQYNNYESRDLWEYKLNLSKEQLRDIELSLFELMPSYADYYYLSRNCSLLVAKLIQSVDETVYFSAGSRIWSSPIEIMKHLVRTKGNSDPANVRASSRRRYISKVSALSGSEVMLIGDMIESDEFTDLSGMAPERQAIVLEALIEFIEYDQSLAGPAKAEKYSLLRQKALFARAKNPVIVTVKMEVPKEENPILILPEKSIRAGVLFGNGEKFALLGVRPSLKSLYSSSKGFMLGMGISVFDLELYGNAHSWGISQFDLLLIDNYQTSIPLRSGLGSGFRLSYGRLHRQPKNPYSLDIDLSRNRGWGNSKHLVFVEGGIFARIISGRERSQLGIFPGVGFVSELCPSIKLVSKIRAESDGLQKFHLNPVLDVGISLSPLAFGDFEFQGRILKKTSSLSLKYNHYLP